MQGEALGCLEANDRRFSDTRTGDPGITLATQAVLGDLGREVSARENAQMMADSPAGT